MFFTFLWCCPENPPWVPWGPEWTLRPLGGLRQLSLFPSFPFNHINYTLCDIQCIVEIWQHSVHEMQMASLQCRNAPGESDQLSAKVMHCAFSAGLADDLHHDHQRQLSQKRTSSTRTRAFRRTCIQSYLSRTTISNWHRLCGVC